MAQGLEIFRVFFLSFSDLGSTLAGFLLGGCLCSWFYYIFSLTAPPPYPAPAATMARGLEIFRVFFLSFSSSGFYFSWLPAGRLPVELVLLYN